MTNGIDTLLEGQAGHERGRNRAYDARLLLLQLLITLLVAHRLISLRKQFLLEIVKVIFVQLIEL